MPMAARSQGGTDLLTVFALNDEAGRQTACVKVEYDLIRGCRWGHTRDEAILLLLVAFISQW
jgi:hypothetical protein